MAEENLDYEVVKSSRAKRHRIDVSMRGVKVVIPKGSSVDPAELVAERREWIEEKVAKFAEHRRRIPERQFADGAVWPYLGEKKQLVVNGSAYHRLEGERIILAQKKVAKSSIKEELEKFFRRRARAYLTGLTDRWAEKIGVKYNRIFIRNQRTRWGSCSSKNNLNYNYRLIMAPPEVVEYIVIHELCHLRYSNHGAKFKRLLASLCPEYKKQENWLKKNSIKLIFSK
ncbi:MAG: M48 family metallopeptidase, partial [bacterium]